MVCQLHYYKASMCTKFGSQIILTSTYKFYHITPVHIQLHWLPVKFKIDFKIFLLTFKALHNKAPEYILTYLLCMKVDAISGHLLMPIYYWWNPKPDLCHTVIEHFAKLPLSSAPKLPRDIRHSKYINSFKCSLKTHLFKTTFNL